MPPTRMRAGAFVGLVSLIVAPWGCEKGDVPAFLLPEEVPTATASSQESTSVASSSASAQASSPTADSGTAALAARGPDMSPKEIAAYIRKHGSCRRRAQPLSEAETRGRAGSGSSRADAGAVPESTTDVKLPSAVVEYVVHQSYDKLRACYEKGLARNPKLAGNVSFRFVITRNGTVSDLLDAGSDLPDTAALACMEKVFGQLCFPPPLWGTLTVVHPIKYSPG